MMVMKIVDMTGRKYGRLTIIRMDGRDSRGNVTWLARCDHGDTAKRPVFKVVSGMRLREGGVRSCGCLLLESSRANGRKCLRHGMSHHPLYQVWRNMKGRCLDEHRVDYSRYGGRGITICRAWLKSDNFLAWAKHSGYASGLTIERRNNDRGYCPSNCYWAPQKVQVRNRRNTVHVKWRGVLKPVIDHCENAGIRYTVVMDRLNRGWTVDDALSFPPERHRKLYATAGGKLRRK